MQIDPLEAVIAWLKTALICVEERVAAKHRYGETWQEDQTGLSVHLDGGSPDLYAPVATPRLEMRIYADDQAKVVQVWRELVGLSRSNKRFEVNTSLGAALVHTFLPASGLSLTYDEVLKKELGIVFFESMVSESSVQ